jgi:hypothetical protein
VELTGKGKGTTQVMYIAKLKDGPKGFKKIFSMILKGFLKWYDEGGGGEWNHIRKNFWSWTIFLLSKYWLSLLFEETLEACFFLSLFSCSVSWWLGGFDDIGGENHFFKNFFSNGFNILVVDAYSGIELCMPTWLNYYYTNGGLVDIMTMDTYSGVKVCTLIFLGEASD